MSTSRRLADAPQCVGCGRKTDKAYLDKDGNCLVCQAKLKEGKGKP